MTDVQQIEAAIGEGDGVAGAAPFRHLLLQFIACENLFCDRLVLDTVPACCGKLGSSVSFAPLGLDPFATRDPGFTPWALFLRRFAACGICRLKSLYAEISAPVSLVAFDPARLIIPAATRLPCLASSLRYRRHNSPGGLHLRRRLQRPGRR